MMYKVQTIKNVRLVVSSYKARVCVCVCAICMYAQILAHKCIFTLYVYLHRHVYRYSIYLENNTLTGTEDTYYGIR